MCAFWTKVYAYTLPDWFTPTERATLLLSSQFVSAAGASIRWLVRMNCHRQLRANLEYRSKSERKSSKYDSLCHSVFLRKQTHQPISFFSKTRL
jgi:hypothetical protein